MGRRESRTCPLPAGSACERSRGLCPLPSERARRRRPPPCDLPAIAQPVRRGLSHPRRALRPGPAPALSLCRLSRRFTHALFAALDNVYHAVALAGARRRFQGGQLFIPHCLGYGSSDAWRPAIGSWTLSASLMFSLHRCACVRRHLRRRPSFRFPRAGFLRRGRRASRWQRRHPRWQAMSRRCALPERLGAISQARARDARSRATRSSPADHVTASVRPRTSIRSLVPAALRRAAAISTLGTKVVWPNP